MCSITPETAKVGSSYSHMRVPGIGCWFSDRSNCSHWSFEAAVLPINPNIYTDQWEPIIIYHSITLLVLYNYAAHAADILTPTTVVQGVDNHSWGLYCRRCYCICVCWGRSSRIFHFSRWLSQLRIISTYMISPFVTRSDHVASRGPHRKMGAPCSRRCGVRCHQRLYRVLLLLH